MANLAVSVTALMSGLLIVLFGGLADQFGRGLIMKVGIWLSIGGSALIGLTPARHGALTAATMLSGRIVQVLSAACVMPSTMALIKTFYEGDGRQRALSFWSIGSWGGSGFCSLFGGLMAVSVGWRSIFWFSIALSVLALFLVRDTPAPKIEVSGQRGRFDWGGLLTFVVAMLAINVLISLGSKIGWFSYPALVLLVVFAAAILTFFHLVDPEGPDSADSGRVVDQRRHVRFERPPGRVPADPERGGHPGHGLGVRSDPAGDLDPWPAPSAPPAR